MLRGERCGSGDATVETHVRRSGAAPLISRKRFTTTAFPACAATLVSGGLPGFATGARSGQWCRELTKVGREDAYDFSLSLLDRDAIFTLSDYLGRPARWLQFFASWCPPCNDEAADVIRIAAKYGAAICPVGVDVEEDPAPVRVFRDRHKIPFPIALDTKGSVFDALGLRNYPTHVFLDAQGVISCLSVGDLTPAQMDNEIAVALARKPILQAPSKPR